jgi:hypothetical protein
MVRPRTLRAIGPSLAGELQLQRVLIGVLRSGAVLARSRGLPEAVNLSEQMSQLTDARYQADDAPLASATSHRRSGTCSSARFRAERRRSGKSLAMRNSATE